MRFDTRVRYRLAARRQHYDSKPLSTDRAIRNARSNIRDRFVSSRFYSNRGLLTFIHRRPCATSLSRMGGPSQLRARGQ